MLKLVKTVYKDPATDPYALRHRDKIKDLDNDENRHLIKPIITVIAEDCKGCEHKFCDPDQLDEHGCYRRPKLVKEAECCGFANPMEMLVARKKEEEDKKRKKKAKKGRRKQADEEELQEEEGAGTKEEVKKEAKEKQQQKGCVVC